MMETKPPETSLESLERRVRELTMVNDLVRTLTSTLDLPGILRLVLDRMRTLTGADALSLLLYDSERDELVFAATETLQENALVTLETPADREVAAWAATTNRSWIVNDLTADPRFRREIDSVPPRNVLAVPLRRGQRSIGVLEVTNRLGAGGFDDADRRALEAVASEMKDAIDPEALCHDPEGVRAALAAVMAAVPGERASLVVFDADGRTMVFRTARGRAGLIDGVRLPSDRGIAGWVARHRQAVRLDDAANDPRHDPRIGKQTGFVPGAMLCVPVLSKEKLLAVIQVMNASRGKGFDDGDLALVQVLADHAAIALENALLYRQVSLASVTDDLTGLGNTRHFHRELPEILARGGPVSLIVADLDNFKAVVDTHGHLAGSRVIAHFGRMIARTIRPRDVAVRFGGDEFVVILPAADADVAAAVGERIRRAIEEEASFEGTVDVSGVTASIGFATYPAEAADGEALFRAADAAMYAVKRAGKNAVAGGAPGAAARESP